MPELKPVEKHHYKASLFNDPDFWFKKGYDCSKQQKYEAAIDYYKRGIRIDWRHQPTMLNLAACFNKIHQHAAALAWYEKIVEVDPHWADALYGLALQYFKIGKYAKSLECVECALREGRKDIVNDIHLSYIQSMCNKKLKNYDKAAEGYKALLKHIELSESKLTFKYIWGMLLILRCQDRKFVAN